MNEIIYEVIYTLLVKVAEPIYFSLFLIIGKNIKEKRLLLTLIMIFEYLMITNIIEFNVWIQLIYTFLSFINLKVLYKEKSQITDIFLFAVSSIFLISISLLSYSIVYFTIKEYFIALLLNRILMFLLLLFGKNIIRNDYKKFCSLWNRHNDTTKIRSLTLRNISIITFNLMFWFINLGMIFFVTYLK